MMQMQEKIMNIDFSAKTVLVTGGSRGIGAAVSSFFAEAGAHVFVNFLPVKRDIEAFNILQEQAAKFSGECCPFSGDISEPEFMESMCDAAVKKTGSIDILVNCAGFTKPQKLLELDSESWNRGISVNLSAAFYGTRAAARHMTKKGSGRIIYIGSSGAITGGGGTAAYTAAKAGIHGLVREVSKELAPQGITVNAVLPAIIETDLLKDRQPDPELRKKYNERTLVGRMGQPEDVAYMVLFLASDYADYITSQLIIVDGGATFK